MCLLPQYEQVGIVDITKQLQDAGLFHEPGILQTVWILHGFIDKDEMVEVNGVEHKRGATLPVSQQKIADTIGVSRRATAHGYLKRLIDADIIRVEKAKIAGKNCYRYIFTIFDLYAQQSETCTDDLLPVRSNDETCTDSNVHNQYNQESIYNPPSKSTGSRESEPDEKRGDFSNQEKKEVITETLDKFDAEAIDVVPTKEIGAVTDALASAKGMTPNEDEQEPVWAFMNVFKRPDGEEWRQSDVQSATILREHFEGVLETHSLNITPIRFFEHCLTETDSWTADGKVDVYPSSFNFFLTALRGKQIVEAVTEKLKSENARDNDIERTKARLDEQKEFKREGIPPQAQAMMDELLGREDRSEI